MKILFEILKFIAPPIAGYVRKKIDAAKERKLKEESEKRQQAIDAADAAQAGRRVEQMMKKAVALDNAAQHK